MDGDGHGHGHVPLGLLYTDEERKEQVLTYILPLSSMLHIIGDGNETDHCGMLACDLVNSFRQPLHVTRGDAGD